MNFAFLLLALFSLCQASVPTDKSVSASLKDTSVGGISGLNLEIAFPFKFEDYIVGFRHKFGDTLDKGPDALFAQKSYDLGSDSSVTVNVEYETSKNLFSLATKWATKKLGLNFLAEADTADKLKFVELSASDGIKGNKVSTSISYDLLKKKIAGEIEGSRDDTTAKITYDTEDEDPVLKVTQVLDDVNSVSPSLSLKSGAIKYGWLRKWDGGSVEATLHPGDKVEFEWKDKSNDGVWKTKGDVPLSDFKSTKVSVSRDWTY